MKKQNSTTINPLTSCPCEKGKKLDTIYPYGISAPLAKEIAELSKQQPQLLKVRFFLMGCYGLKRECNALVQMFEILNQIKSHSLGTSQKISFEVYLVDPDFTNKTDSHKQIEYFTQILKEKLLSCYTLTTHQFDRAKDIHLNSQQSRDDFNVVISMDPEPMAFDGSENHQFHKKFDETKQLTQIQQIEKAMYSKPEEEIFSPPLIVDTLSLSGALQSQAKIYWGIEVILQRTELEKIFLGMLKNMAGFFLVQEPKPTQVKFSLENDNSLRKLKIDESAPNLFQISKISIDDLHGDPKNQEALKQLSINFIQKSSLNLLNQDNTLEIENFYHENFEVINDIFTMPEGAQDEKQIKLFLQDTLNKKGHLDLELILDEVQQLQKKNSLPSSSTIKQTSEQTTAHKPLLFMRESKSVASAHVTNKKIDEFIDAHLDELLKECKGHPDTMDIIYNAVKISTELSIDGKPKLEFVSCAIKEQLEIQSIVPALSRKG